MWLPASTTPSTRYLVPKAPKHTFPSGDGGNEAAIAEFAMSESERPLLSDIDLSKISEEELLDAIASAHEESLALESKEDNDAESSPENETEEKADLDPFPREEIAALKSWCTPHMAQAARGVRRYVPQVPFPLKAAHPTSTGNFAPAAVCAQASATPLPSPASPSKIFSHAQSARPKKKARCALLATTTYSKGSPHAVTLLSFPAWPPFRPNFGLRFWQTVFPSSYTSTNHIAKTAL